MAEKMEVKKHHPWLVIPREAEEIQSRLAARIDFKCPFTRLDQIKTIAAADVYYAKKDDNLARASVAVFSYPELELLEEKNLKIQIGFPYLPGLFAFREGPGLEKVFKKINTVPDVVLFDGHGQAHPRRLGLATHLGIILELPTIGCAKTFLYGKYEEPVRLKGAYTFLKNEQGTLIGEVLRTQKNVRPLFVSPGNKMTIELASDIVLSCCRRYRLPEPLRYVHQMKTSFLEPVGRSKKIV